MEYSDLLFEHNLAEDYLSRSQIGRILTENWVGKHVFCPACGNKILPYPSNKPVADFFCNTCVQDFELKSKSSSFGNKIVDGAYETMISRLESEQNPHFFLLQHNTSSVQNLIIIPKHFFTTNIIEKRNPLSPTSRRAGWVGCNINITNIPASGIIYYVKNEVVVSHQTVLTNWRRTLFLQEESDAKTRGWLLDIMCCIEKIPNISFTLTDIYCYAEFLQELHPTNHHIRDKIRQQLQLLRDYGYIEFTTRATYRKL